MKPLLDRTNLEQFRTIVARRLGLQYEDGKLDYLAEVARQRMKLVGSARFETYLESLISSPQGAGEFRALAEQVAIPLLPPVPPLATRVPPAPPLAGLVPPATRWSRY